MTRTIIEVRPNRSGFRVFLYEPPGHPKASQDLPFPYSARHEIPLAFDRGTGSVDAMGKYMMNALSKHPAVREAIEHHLDDGPGALLVRTALGTETLPWETLFARGSFMALDRRWPIARQDPRAGAREASRADFQPPLRVLAILAADEKTTDTADASQWKALSEALAKAKFPVAVTALVARDDLLNTINGFRSPIVRAEAEFVPPGRELLEQAGSYEPPHILHFFCHGLVLPDSNKAMLQLSTRTSVLGAGKPVELEAGDIKELGGDTAWLATLNCCRSASPTDGVGSLAFAVMQNGIPTVTGMREPVSVPDANAFTRAFYAELMAELAAVVEHQGEKTDIDWPSMLFEPRMAIAEANCGRDPIPIAAQSSRAWTLPALYLGWSFYQLVGRPAPADVRPTGRVTSRIPPRLLRWLAPVRRNVAPALSEEERARIQTQINLLRDLEAKSLGAPPEVLEQYRRQITVLERQVYGATPESSGGEPPQ